MGRNVQAALLSKILGNLRKLTLKRYIRRPRTIGKTSRNRHATATQTKWQVGGEMIIHSWEHIMNIICRKVLLPPFSRRRPGSRRVADAGLGFRTDEPKTLAKPPSTPPAALLRTG
jgi:hypothetical protein